MTVVEHRVPWCVSVLGVLIIWIVLLKT